MGYHVTLDGAFQLTPPADEPARAQVAEAGRGWMVSPNGRLLYLPDQHPYALDALEFLVHSVLPELGLVASGNLAWRGEDGAEGQVSVGRDSVHVHWPEEGQLSRSEVARLLGRLADGTKPERIESVEILEAFQLSSPSVVDALARAASDSDVDVRIRAANALTSLGPRAAAAVPVLVCALEDPEPWMQAAAAEALGAIGPAAAAALPALQRLMHHPSYGPAGRAKEAIARIGS